MEKYPNFCNDENEIYSLCMSDDIDSLLSCNLLTYIKDYKTEHFYDFKKFHSMINRSNKSAIGVDIALESGKCWDNHVVKVQSHDKVNPNSANINSILGFHRGNYTNKAVLSTLLQIISYYNIKISETSREQQMVLLAIDSAYLGHFNPRYKDTQRKFLEMLDMGVLIDRIEKETKENFDKVKNWLSGKIVMDKEGYLKTNLPLKQLQQYFPDFPIFLPDGQFKVVKEFSQSKNSVDLYYPYKKPGNLFSFALRNTNKMNYTKF